MLFSKKVKHFAFLNVEEPALKIRKNTLSQVSNDTKKKKIIYCRKILFSEIFGHFQILLLLVIFSKIAPKKTRSSRSGLKFASSGYKHYKNVYILAGDVHLGSESHLGPSRRFRHTWYAVRTASTHARITHFGRFLTTCG